MKDAELEKYLWKGLDLKRYSVVQIIPQDSKHAVIIIFSNDKNDPTGVCSTRATATTLIPPNS